MMKRVGFASQNLLCLQRKTRFAHLSPPADSRAFGARCPCLFLTDRVKPSLWQRIITPRTDAYKYSFYPKTISAWNKIPLSTITVLTVQMFNNFIHIQLPVCRPSCTQAQLQHQLEHWTSRSAPSLVFTCTLSSIFVYQSIYFGGRRLWFWCSTALDVSHVTSAHLARYQSIGLPRNYVEVEVEVEYPPPTFDHP